MDDHPEGPRTLWTQVRDGLPLLPETVARGLELEQGRHPALTELREALGFDLDLDGVQNAARDVRLPREEPPTDELLTHFIDSMYCGIASSRLVRVVVSNDGLTAMRAQGSVRLRDGEMLSVLVLVDNQTERDLDFSARMAGGAESAAVEAGRVASVLVHSGETPIGTGEIDVQVECDSQKATQQIPIEVSASWTLSLQLLDDETGEPMPARVYLSDDLGAAWPADTKVRRDEHDNAFFHVESRFEATVSGEAKLIIARGMEYEPLELTVPAPSSAEESATVRLRRWSHMSREGWWSGDVHVHLHYGGEYLLDPAHASLVQRGEDVNFMNMMVANQGSAFVHDHGYFEGRPHELSDAEHILRWGEEYRNDFYGHLCMYGITELVPPIYSGFRLSEHPHDLPANAVAADRCHEAGGTLSYAHPLFGNGDLERVFTHPRTVEAKELPVDMALGKVDALDVMSYPGSDLETSELWYKLLNCGFRVPATAGTDTFMNFVGSGIFSNPPAGNRVFVNVDGAFTTESWCQAIREGRTFVTNGPMLSLSVEGQPIGASVRVEPGSRVRVEAEARSLRVMDRLELIVNGDIVATTEASDEGRAARIETEVTVTTDCWISARALGPSHPQVFGGPLFGHTSPVYVTVGEESLVQREAAAYFVDWIDRLIGLCNEQGRYPSDTQRDEVVELFRSAQAHYERIVSG